MPIPISLWKSSFGMPNVCVYVCVCGVLDDEWLTQLRCESQKKKKNLLGRRQRVPALTLCCRQTMVNLSIFSPLMAQGGVDAASGPPFHLQTPPPPSTPSRHHRRRLLRHYITVSAQPVRFPQGRRVAGAKPCEKNAFSNCADVF